MLPFAQFKGLLKAPVEHLFATHEWCSPEWCFSDELNQATEKYSQKETTAVPSLPPTTAADGASVPIPTTAQVVSPAIYFLP